MQLIFVVIFYPSLVSAQDELDQAITKRNIELEQLMEIINSDAVYSTEVHNCNLLPLDTGLSNQMSNLLGPFITSVNPLTTQYLDLGIIEREYEIIFTGSILNAIESIQSLYPLSKIKYIEWRNAEETQGMMKVLVFTNDNE